MTKEELMDYSQLLLDIKKLEEKLFEIESRATKCTTRITDDPHSQSQIHDSMAEAVAQCQDISEEINRLVKISHRMLAQIKSESQKLSVNQGYIIYLRYCKCYSWEDICKRTGYGRTKANEVHNKAIKMLQKPQYIV